LRTVIPVRWASWSMVSRSMGEGSHTLGFALALLSTL
jgi:hypothetical protein